MRCPKCGYISFDHVEQCLKCKKNIKAASENLHGSVLNVAAPAFLKFSSDAGEENLDEFDIGMDGGTDTDDDFLDSDLQVLVGDEEQDEMGEIEIGDDDEIQFNFDDDESPEEADETEGEIEIDLGQFEESPEPALSEEDFDELGEEELLLDEAESQLAMDVPEELSDMSDLSPPAEFDESETIAPDQGELVEDEGAAVDMELDDLEFDLGLDDLAESSPASSVDDAQEPVLALDDIDFGEAFGQSDSSKKQSSGSLDMDDDLDFDLDLGGISIHKDE